MGTRSPIRRVRCLTLSALHVLSDGCCVMRGGTYARSEPLNELWRYVLNETNPNSNGTWQNLVDVTSGLDEFQSVRNGFGLTQIGNAAVWYMVGLIAHAAVLSSMAMHMRQHTDLSWHVHVCRWAAPWVASR